MVKRTLQATQTLHASVHPSVKRDVRHRSELQTNGNSKVFAYERSPVGETPGREGTEDLGFEARGVCHLMHAWTMQGHPVRKTYVGLYFY